MPNAEWKARNRGRYREMERQWRENNRERVREYNRAYVARNKDLIKERDRTRPPAPGKPDVYACRRCGEVKPFDTEHFPTRFCNKFKLDYRCKVCRNAEALDRATAKKYGLSQEEAAQMRASGQCAICGSTERLHIDHCHASGRVRGLLCALCNTGIGMFAENPGRLRNAALYCEIQS